MTINPYHRKELLRFLLLKTAPVRSGVKPAELLRVRHCYQSRNQDGFQFCLYRRDILETLALDYRELRIEDESSLILFHHRGKLAEILALPENQTLLRRLDYPVPAPLELLLEKLRERFQVEKCPHEVGVFIGYPAKDVQGFIDNLPRTTIHRGNWVIFGDAGESLARMELYRRVESFAATVFDLCEDTQSFFEKISSINIKHRSMANG